MAETTKIEWADATLNFWIGCTEVSNGPKGACANCYARTWGARFGVEWGTGQPRRKTVGNFAKAMKLERKAIAEGRPIFCFSNSLADIFDNEVPIDWLEEAFAIMRKTPHVIYLLLTKRPQNIVKRSMAAGELPSNAAIGCTVVTQPEADHNIPALLAAKAELNAVMAFVSIEPLMEAMDIAWAISRNRLEIAAGFLRRGSFSPGLETLSRIDWVIVGGESGAHARPMHPDWARRLRDQCAAADVPFMFKQWGEWIDHDQRGVDMLGTARSPLHLWAENHASVRIGKNGTGRALDGVTHDARPVIP